MKGVGHTGGGSYPNDPGFAASNQKSETTGAFPADIGATTGHGMTGIHAPDMETGYAGSGTQGQLHRGGGGGGGGEQRTSTHKGEENEKKGIMEKIKEKLPGSHN